MIDFEPKCITFDCYGTLTHFQMGAVTRELVPADRLEAFLDDFEAERFDEVLGPTKPYFGYHELQDLSGLPPLLGL